MDRGAFAVGLAIAVFSLGGAVYLFDRPGVLVSGSDLGSARASLGPLADSLPSFAHTFAFATWILAVANSVKICAHAAVEARSADTATRVVEGEAPGACQG